ncbi:MAG: septation protein A [Pseudomonadota bacterium]
MKILFDLFPVILFFIVFKLFDIYAATATAIGATVAQIAWTKWRHGKVDNMLWVSFAIISVLGGATLLLHNENFIKWKPTILYWVFGSVLLFSNLIFNKNLIRALLHDKISLPARIWTQLNLSWCMFFYLMGAVNLYVAFYLYAGDTDAWVNFKLFGATGIMIGFLLLQGIVLAKYAEEDQEKN